MENLELELLETLNIENSKSLRQIILRKTTTCQVRKRFLRKKSKASAFRQAKPWLKLKYLIFFLCNKNISLKEFNKNLYGIWYTRWRSIMNIRHFKFRERKHKRGEKDGMDRNI